MEARYRRPKKQAVSLTSLLDLLFVMIFVSLIQQKTITPVDKPSTDPKPVPKVAEKPKVIKEKVSAAPVVKPVHAIRATFNFYGTNSNPKIPNGSFLMSGKYESKDGSLQLGGIAWLKRPENYDMVPLSGKIDPVKGEFTGRVEFIGCKQFTLTRKLKANNTPISGEWVGTYDCSQGPTGLTLTIQ